MKRKLMVIICATTISLVGSNRLFASPPVDPGAVIVDVVVARPFCFVATVVGSVFFVVSLPLAATSKSVHRTAQALVVWPAQETFIRPLGDFTDMGDY